MIGKDTRLRPRTLAAIARSQAAGIPVIVATGRMFRSVRPFLEEAGILEPVICYQGAAVVDPASGSFLLHEPIPLPLARDAITLLTAEGHPPNCYVGDELFVAHHTEYSRAYADFQHLSVTEVGDLGAWLTEPPTKLVAVAEPSDLPPLRDRLAERFNGSLFITTSLPHLLELGHPSVSKGTGLAFVTDRLELDPACVVSFGDGENDVELIMEAGFGIAVEGGHPRLREHADWVCPGPEDEGVASVIDAYLDSLA